jgi:hypothetical protein
MERQIKLFFQVFFCGDAIHLFKVDNVQILHTHNFLI